MNYSSTLHQLLSAPSHWASIPHITASWQANDALVLLGEAAQGYSDARLQAFDRIYILQADASLLGLNAPTPHCHWLTYDEWAQMILNYNKHISWK